MQLNSSSFSLQGQIPERYTCVGEDKSPQLTWGTAPEGVKTFVLICDDPDAPGGIWDHWIIYNIPSYVRQLEEGIQDLPGGCEEGLNSWNKKGYRGPCPPGGEHRYCFKLYALNTQLYFKDTPRKKDLEQAMQGHVLATAQLVGRFQKLSLSQ